MVGKIMDTSNLFFKALKIGTKDRFALQRFANTTGIPVKRLNYYNSNKIIPSGTDLQIICDAVGITPTELMLKMGVLDARLITLIQNNAVTIYQLIKQQLDNKTDIPPMPSLVYIRSHVLFVLEVLLVLASPKDRLRLRARARAPEV